MSVLSLEAGVFGGMRRSSFKHLTLAHPLLIHTFQTVFSVKTL